MKRKQTSARGSAVSEYGLMISLVALLVIGSLYGLRDSIAHLFGMTASEVIDYNVLAPVGPAKGEAALQTQGGQSATVLDPVTGLPIQGTMSSVNSSTNVTSVDGNEITSVGSWGQAQTLEQLAQQEKDPEFSAYYAELARLSYYMGAAEGRLDGLEPFVFAEGYYEPDDALVDLMNLQGQLQEKLKNPPVGMTETKAFKTALPLADDVSNIAEKYRAAFKSQIGPDGNVLPFRITNDRQRGPGTALSVAPYIYSHPNPEYVGDYPSTDMMAYDVLKSTAKQVVADTSTHAPLTKQTLTDAIDLDTVHASTTGP